jgi:Phosphotransferase enzyme family
MTETTTILEMAEYRVVLVQPNLGTVLALDENDEYRFPRIGIPPWKRPVHELCKAIQDRLGATSVILEILSATDGPDSCVVAELIGHSVPAGLQPVALNQVLAPELTKEERPALRSLLNGENKNPFARIGWIDEAFAWIRDSTGRNFSCRTPTEQLNAGGGFSLLRFGSDDGRDCWLKATGEPNIHEFSVTCCLSQLCPGSMPKLIATKKEWNAWLTEDAGRPLSDSPRSAVLVSAVQSLASLQLQTIIDVDLLLAAGAFDQRLPVLSSHVDEVIAYLIDAMARQSSTKVAPLGRDRILALGEILRDVCVRLEALGIPDTLIHNDLNPGNVLYDGTGCVFIDWSEAAIGNPFLAIERFCLLSGYNAAELRRAYGKCWSEYLSETSIDEAYKLVPLLAIFAYLYGRGNWLKDTTKVRPQFESYARALARHMDRAARNPVLLETLCR